MSYLFRYTFPSIILFAMSFLGCAGSTAVQRQHHLLHSDSAKVSVCFLRLKENAMGMKGRPIEILIDNEKLLDLSVGEYTFLDIKPGKYNVMISGWAFDRTHYADIWASRNYILELGLEDSVFLLFTLEKVGFWSIVGDRIANQVDMSVKNLIEDLTTFNIPLGKNLWLQFSASEGSQNSTQVQYQNEYGTIVASVSREKAIEVASQLKPVEDAQNSPLLK